MASFDNKVISRQILTWVFDAEHNTPYAKTFGSWSRRRDELITIHNRGLEEPLITKHKRRHGGYFVRGCAREVFARVTVCEICAVVREFGMG